MLSSSKEANIMLSDWIRRAVASGENLFLSPSLGADLSSQLSATARNSMVICSDDYLMPALRLAYSLADQICKVEEAGKSPTVNADWVDNIFICDGNNNSSDRRRSLDSVEFLDSLDSIGFDPSITRDDDFREESLFESDTLDHNPMFGEESDQTVEEGDNSISIRAALSSSLFYPNDGDLDKDAMQRIHALGGVFYVIFSGGERPVHASAPTAIMDQQSNAKSDAETEELSQELSEEFDPRPLDMPLDLGGELSIFDSIEDDFTFNRERGDSVAVAATAAAAAADNYDDAHENPNKKRVQTSSVTHRKCSVSVDPLTEKSLPTPLCDLVFNMLDCTNGALRGEDSYQCMSDVRSDLRLMLDNPSTFLRNQDMRELSTTGLQFLERTMFGRTNELSTIKDAYRRSISGRCGMVTISGSSGTGKSLLAAEFGKHVCAEGGIFLSGKFDQLQQGKPFSALASAFDQYCDMLIKNEDLASTMEDVACQLRSALGMETYHLSRIIPNLAAILGSETSVLDYSEDCINAQKRVQYLLCRFVEVISSSSSAPITLFLDDLQWADAASIAAVSQLSFARGPSTRKNFFFLGCVRERDSTTTWLPEVDVLIAGGINIKLECMDEQTLNKMVSETLCLSPRLTRALSNVMYLKTKGNPFFVSRLLCSLNKERLLYPSLSRRRWEWDMTKIRSRKLPDDVAILLTDSLSELPKEVQSALFVLSCFGASSESAFVESQGLDSNILENLDIAVAEGLVDKVDDQYRFTHDRIQEAAYNKVPAHKRCLIHFQYGLELSSLLLSDTEANRSFLFTAVNQLNLGGPPAAEDKSQNLIAAQLNLRAGKQAMQMSDYETAYSYFDCGISFLRKKHWQEHYALSLELFSLAAKCALTNGDHVSLGHLVKEVVVKAHFFVDKLDVYYFDMCALAFSSRLAESIEKGRSILLKLGIDVQGTNVDACVNETKDLLSSYTDDTILNCKQMSDPTMILAMKFLGKLEIGMTLIMPKSVPYVTFKIIQLSLAHGMSPVSPIGFAFYGSYIAMQGNIYEGYHYVNLALSLLDKVGSRESAGVVICVCTHVRAYVEPLQATLEYYNEGYAAAMASGDGHIAVINKFGQSACLLFAGENLLKVHDQITTTIKLAEERKQQVFMVHTQLMQRSMSKLIGMDEEPCYSSEGLDILGTNSSVLRSHHYQKAYVSFIFRSYYDMKDSIEKYCAYQDEAWATLFVAQSIHTFYIGLISCWVSRKSKDQQWHQRGIQSKLALRKWSETSQWTFENKWYLLEAENSFCSNDFEAAKSYYDKAIESAKSHKFIHEEALACELAAYFYLESGEREQTMEYLMAAQEKYREWGALGKCDSLIKFIETMGKLWQP